MNKKNTCYKRIHKRTLTNLATNPDYPYKILAFGGSGMEKQIHYLI